MSLKHPLPVNHCGRLKDGDSSMPTPVAASPASPGPFWMLPFVRGMTAPRSALELHHTVGPTISFQATEIPNLCVYVCVCGVSTQMHAPMSVFVEVRVDTGVSSSISTPPFF